MSKKLYDVMTNPESTPDDICNLLCEYHALTEEQKDAFFDLRYGCDAFMHFWENEELIIRALSVTPIHEDVLYLFEEHFAATDFTYHQAVTIMEQYLTHEDEIDVCCIEDILEDILKNCRNNAEDLLNEDVEKIINWFTKYLVSNDLPMICFLAWLEHIKKYTPEEIKAFCNNNYMPSYDEVEDNFWD